MKENAKYLLLFAALTAIYFWDVFLKGLSLAIGDAAFHNYPLMLAVSEQYSDLTPPLWNPYIFSGFPLMGSMQAAAFYPPLVLLSTILPPITAFNLYVMLHIAMAGFFTYLYMRLLGLGRFSAVFSGIVFGLLGYLPSRLVHTAVLATGAWLPLVVYSIERIRLKPDARNIALASIVIALQAYAGHPQILFYTHVTVLLLIGFRLYYHPSGNRLRFLSFALLAVIAGLLMASPQLYATYELSRTGERAALSYEFFSQFSFPLHMLPAIVFPFLYGKGYGGAFWGPDIGVDVMDGFVGVLALALALTAFWRGEKKNQNVRIWGAIAVAALILSMGDTLRPLHRIMYHVPLFNSFRSPSRHWLEITFALSVMSGFGMASLVELKEAAQRRAMIIVLAVLLAASAICFTVLRGTIAGKLSGMDLVRPEAIDGALRISSPAVFIPMITLLLCLALLLLIKRFVWIKYVLVLLVLFEAFTYKTLYHYPKAEAINGYQVGLFGFLSGERENRAAFITLNVPDSMLSVGQGISSVDGFDPLRPVDYGKLLNMEMFGYSYEWPDLIRNNLILSMLNAKYLVVDEGFGDLGAVRGRVVRGPGGDTHFAPPIGTALPEVEEYAPIYRNVFVSEDVVVYENLNVLPRAYPVTRIKEADTVEEVRMNYYAFQADPWREALLSAKDIMRIGRREFSPGRATIRDYGPERVTVATEFEETGFVVLADQYYPGWRAYIDGKQTPVYRTNGVLRGVVVPEGRHELVFRYMPKRIYALVAAGAITFAVMVIIIFQWPPEKKNQASPL